VPARLGKTAGDGAKTASGGVRCDAVMRRTEDRGFGGE